MSDKVAESGESPASVGAAGDLGSISGSGRSPGERNDNPGQEDSTDRIPWVAESQTRLSPYMPRQGHCGWAGGEGTRQRGSDKLERHLGWRRGEGRRQEAGWNTG